MPTISPFELDGNHFNVWSPSENTCKHTCEYQGFLPSFSKNSSPNVKLLSDFDIKGKLVTNVE